jgi:1,4-dihydroxy-2-naphthoyl-CoA hydrolase
MPFDMDVDALGPFLDFIGLKLTEANGDRVAGVWSAGPHLHQPYGILHGGVHCSIVETLASYGGALWLGERGKVVGVTNSTDFFRAVAEGQLTSVGEPLHRGKSQQVWIVETKDEQGRLVARGQVRLQNLAPRPD